MVLHSYTGDMICPSCTSDAPTGARFCSVCGHLLVQTEERRIVTVLFADLVGFTGLSENRDPEELKHLIDRCFQRLVADVTAFGGTVDKIIGDAIVVLFGAPTAHEDDPERAVRAALQMQRTLLAFAAEQTSDMRMRIGVNTGEVLVGALKAGGDYTAMGDTVNVASRLQNLAAPGEILVGPSTRSAVSEVIEFDDRGMTDLRGREGSIQIAAAIVEIGPPGRRKFANRAPLIGRELEQAHLSSAIEVAIMKGRACLINVLGEAGIGKTRLASEVASQAETEHEAIVLEGRVLPYGETSPLRALGDSVAGAAGLAASDDSIRAREKIAAMVRNYLDPGDLESVEQIAEVVLHLIGRPTSIGFLETDRRVPMVRDGMRKFFVAVSNKYPVVLILRDVQWADQRLLDVVEQMLELLSDRPFVVMATARWALDEVRWVAMPGRHNTVVINLDPLDMAATSLLGSALLGAPVSEVLATELYERSGGNPFFLEEISTLLREEDFMNPGVRFDIEKKMIGELPKTLVGLVAARLDSLPQAERRMVENAAVLGRRGPVYGLLLMGDESKDQSSFRHLVDKDILSMEGEWWRFRSDLVRDVAYSMLTKSVRADRHLMVADWLAANTDDASGDAVAAIATHYAAAAELGREKQEIDTELSDKAIDWLGKAGCLSEERDSHYSSVELSTRALSMLRADDPRNIELALCRGRARLALGELPGAKDDAGFAKQLADRVGDKKGTALAIRLSGEVVAASDDPTDASALYEEALTKFRGLGASREIAQTLRLQGMSAIYNGEHLRADGYFEEARSIFIELDDVQGLAWCLENLAWLSFQRGELEEADQRVGKAISLFKEINDLSGLAFAEGLLAFLMFHRGMRDEAEELARKVRDVSHERGERFGEAMMDLLLASALLWSGRVEAAVARATEAELVFREIENVFGVVQALGLLGRAYAALGSLSDSRISHDMCIAEALAMPGKPLEGFARVVAAGAASQSGDPDKALEHLDQAGAAFGGRPVIGSVDLDITRGLLQIQLGRVEEALKTLGAIKPVAASPNSYLLSTLALAQAASGSVKQAQTTARQVLDDGRGTYLDERTAMLVLALSDASQGATAEAQKMFNLVISAVDSTESRMSQAVVRLARAMAEEFLELDTAKKSRVESDEMLAALEVEPIGWELAFGLVLRSGNSFAVSANSR